MAIAHLATRPQCEWSYYWQAFHDLSTERQLGFGAVGPIPESKIEALGKRDGLTPHELSVLHSVVRQLDNRQRELAHDKAEKRRKQTAS